MLEVLQSLVDTWSTDAKNLVDQHRIWWTSTEFGGLCPPNDGFLLNPDICRH